MTVRSVHGEQKIRLPNDNIQQTEPLQDQLGGEHRSRVVIIQAFDAPAA